MKFNVVAAKKAFNLAVDAHKKSGGNPTQVRPKIKSIGPNRDGERLLSYANGYSCTMDEVGLASIIHSYTALVALISGRPELIYVDQVLSEAMPRALRAKATGLSPYTLFGIRFGTGALLTALEANPKSHKDLKPICENVHGGISDVWPEFCGK